MKDIIKEEMRYRKRVVEYAIKHDNNAAAARRYHNYPYASKTLERKI